MLGSLPKVGTRRYSRGVGLAACVLEPTSAAAAAAASAAAPSAAPGPAQLARDAAVRGNDSFRANSRN
eukprot:5425245-Pleurochrysis_carterae.AAC.2